MKMLDIIHIVFAGVFAVGLMTKPLIWFVQRHDPAYLAMVAVGLCLLLVTFMFAHAFQKLNEIRAELKKFKD